MSIYIKISLAILSTLIFISCDNRQINHPNEIEKDSLDDNVVVTAPQVWNTFEAGKPVSLEILNNTESVIIFDQDFEKKIYLLENNEFLELENKISVINGQERILYPNETAGTVLRVDTNNRSMAIRVYILGRKIDTGETVSSYIDLHLFP